MALRKTFLLRTSASAGTAHRDRSEHNRGDSHDAQGESPAKSGGPIGVGSSSTAGVR